MPNVGERPDELLRPERIVVGVDEHDASLRAVDWLAARRTTGGSEIEVVTVTDGLSTDPVAERDRLDRAAERLAAARPAVTVRTTLLYGAPDRMLLMASEHADLLVIGSRRRHRVRSALDGWIPVRVPTLAAVPTVVVAEDWEPAHGDVVLGVDDATGDAALRFAAVEAIREHRRLSLLRTWKLPVPTATGALGVLDDPELYEDHNRAVLGDAERLLHARYPGLRHRTLLEEGDAPTCLASHARAGASLVVLGRRHRTTLGGVLFGSTAHELVLATATPVCVVPVRRRALDAR